MFCVNCGTQLPEGSRFCIRCGTAMAGNTDSFKKSDSPIGKRIVSSTCTSCGANLEVNPEKNIATCPFCDSTYIVDQEINNTGSNSERDSQRDDSEANIENLLRRARTFEEEGQLEAALDYFSKALDMDLLNDDAQDGMFRVAEKMEEQVYFETEGNSGFKFGRLLLKRGVLIFREKNGNETIYDLNAMKNIKKSVGCIAFDYSVRELHKSYGCKSKEATKWVEILNKAQQGIYPEVIIKEDGGKVNKSEF